ncbi:ABC transporter ATP-binding protein [Stakelama sp. CBK3Z-3]|uniref:ABC transporter ATP-binding protein n=1 Tax=Stakelama flava TaxID=2860338 RepID=A0ABS6XJ30_9SPHN|nr:ABC transporter ATP-binding protein [Stakelama flava]MBW4330205.1 ABC transporter ATP-binding protein [Stakelama flava]
MVSIVAEHVGVELAGRPVVRDVSAAFRPGSFVGILGPNGAGKSTLVRALLGLVPASGLVRIGEAPLNDLTRRQIARKVAYLPQGQALHWPLSVERLVALGRLPHLTPYSRIGADDREAIARAMALAEVDMLAGRIATELSGGERARVLLARALAVEASALIADEPLASLDPAHQLQGMEILRGQADSGKLVLAVFHDLNLAMRFCDRLLVLDAGRLVADGPPETVLTPQLLADVYGITAAFGGAGQRLVVPLERMR